ncbi:hypothetical protein [Ferrimonas balearica]|uniref:hypothetical protein n=1 Tax=Ferrimonas balearica TaxID=44012 RepID=UPI001C99E000|nr:hypothetical protein [Ferrimonas balearica]MBY5993828.1 hypothetical protein [Ferrimonas balearica]
MMDSSLGRKLALGATALTGLYFLLWLAGPLWLAEAGSWQGLPLWFWFSCVAAPLVLVALLLIWLGGRRG